MGSDGARPGGAAPRARRSARFAHVALTLGLAATASAQDAPRILDLVGRARSGDVAARAELAGVFRDAAPPLDRARLHALGEAAIELAATGDGAVEILERARELLEGAGLPESEVNVARQLGHEWMRRGEPDKAIAEWRRGSRLPARALRPWLLVELAAALRGRGEWAGAEEAIADAEKALVPGDAFHHMARAAVFGERGQQELDLGVANLAFRSFLEERRVADEIGEPVLRLAARLHEIHYALAVEDGAEATRLASEALADPALVASAPGTAARLRALRALADPDVAHGEADLAAAAGDPAVEPATRLAASTALARLEIERGALDAAARRLAALRPVGNSLAGAEIRALEAHIAREQRSPSLAERLAALRATYRELLDEWARVPAREGGIGFLEFKARQRVLSELVLLSIAVEGETAGTRSAFDDLLRAQAQGSLSRSLRLRSGSLEEIRATLLPAGTGILAYFPAPERSHVFVVDREHLRHVAIAPSEKTKPAMGALRDATERPPTAPASGAQEPARRVAELLFPEEVRERLESWRSVIVVGADLMHGVPLACLPATPRGPLGLTHDLSEVPSLPVALWLASRGRATEAAALDYVLAVAPRLPASVRERWPSLRDLEVEDAQLDRLTRPFGAGRFRVLSGEAATRDAALGAASSGARVLQIVAHGVQADERARPAGLALDPVVFSEDVESVHAPPLVVISSCGSALAPSRRGEDGVQHLGGAFLRSGARAVVVSRSDLELRSTLELSAVLHERLAIHGDAPAEALRRARAAVASQPRFAHPYYWALPQLLGLGDAPVFPERARTRSPWIAAAAAATAIAAALWTRRRRAAQLPPPGVVPGGGDGRRGSGTVPPT